MVGAIIGILFFLILGVGAILLQVFLSRKDSKWYGLILPIISLGIGILVVVGLVGFSSVRRATETVRMMDENGVIVETRVTNTAGDLGPMVGETMMIALNMFLLFGLPTIVLLVIYFASREKQRKRKELERMQVQDLE